MTHETIRLVMGERYTDAVTDILEPEYDVVPGPPPETGDLCLIERSRFPELRGTLESIVEEEHPAFYPIVLFRQRTPTGWIDLLETDDRPLIDDVVTMPIDRRLFQRRIGNLLTRRRYSISLSRHHRRRHEQFDGLFDAIAEPAVVLVEGTDIVQMNDPFCRVFGENRESLYGRSIGSVLADEDLEGVIETELSNGGDERLITVEDGDGDERHFKPATRRLSLHGAAYTVLILTDVTRLSRRLERLEQQLETTEHRPRMDSE